MRGNLDIWTEILRYFATCAAHETKEEVIVKRRTLLSVALLSPVLTNLALDGLWRSMTSLEPVCRVINARDSSNDTLAFQQDGSGGYWILRKPLTGDQIGCGLNYLSRIQDFYLRPTGTRESALWSMLVSSLGLSATASLLPALRSLSLDFGATSTIGSWINVIMPLVSPTLQQISYLASSTHVMGVETFQNMLKSQSLELTHVAYRGYPSSDLLQRYLLFDGLESLSLEFDFEGRNIQRYTQSPVTTADIFMNLRCLQDLKIDLRVYPLRGPTPPEQRPKPIVSSVLRKLHIKGDANDLQEFLLDGLTSPSLLSLSVSVASVGGLVWKTLCDRAVSTFPHIQGLSIEAVLNSNVPQLLMPDLSSVISLSTLRSFRLSAVPHCLTDANIIGLANAWPELRTLAILNEYRAFFSATILTELSKSRHLYELALPLNLSDLEKPLPWDTPTADCPLMALTVTKYFSAPSTWDGKIDLARNLLMLFPMLSKISADDVQQQPYMSELQKLMQGFHSAIAIQTHRRALRDYARKQAAGATVKHEIDSERDFMKVVVDK